MNTFLVASPAAGTSPTVPVDPSLQVKLPVRATTFSPLVEPSGVAVSPMEVMPSASSVFSSPASVTESPSASCHTTRSSNAVSLASMTPSALLS